MPKIVLIGAGSGSGSRLAVDINAESAEGVARFGQRVIAEYASNEAAYWPTISDVRAMRDLRPIKDPKDPELYQYIRTRIRWRCSQWSGPKGARFPWDWPRRRRRSRTPTGPSRRTHAG